MARLEETGKEKEEPDPPGSRLSTCLYMEQNENGRLGSVTKPDSGHDYYHG